MDFRLLRHVTILADTLHFGRASELCHISPSTLSRSIQQVESELGTRLFERDNRHVTLTPQGITFQRYAKETLEQWETQKRTLAATTTPRAATRRSTAAATNLAIDASVRALRAGFDASASA